MSRWLSQVNSFLEKLDDQTQNYVEETINNNEEQSGEAEESANLDSILAQRGLAVVDSNDDDVDDDVDDEDDDTALDAALLATDDEKQDGANDSADEPEKIVKPSIEQSESATAAETDPQSGQASSDESDKHQIDFKALEPAMVKEETETNDGTTNIQTNTKHDNAKETDDEEKQPSTEPPANRKAPPPPPPPRPAPAPEKSIAHETKQGAPPLPSPPPPPAAAPKQAPVAPPPPQPSDAKPQSAPAPTVIVKQDPNPALVKEAREAQKEVRTLRRHVVTLNKQLETAEAEVAAQRKELEQAGERMEKDRAKAKLERDNERKRHAEELQALQAQHEQMMVDQKTRMEQQLASMSQKLREMEQTRMQEGGNWDKELQGAVEREQLLIQQNAALEDEKATLLSQISILQSQQEALGDRIESLSQTADAAMEREREAEERLDQALSVHAHQISQRQAREGELERTIAELGAAMAALRNRENSRLAEYNKNGSEISDTAGENTSQDSSLRVRLDMALHDLETVQANLDLERQRTEALQRELRDISNERTEEATNARMRQNKYDRQVAELTLQLTRLQQQSNSDPTMEGSARNSKDSSGNNDLEIHDLKNQIKELSEEILKSREKIGCYSSEVATLKNRLRGAVDRAEKAEAAMEEAMTVQDADSFDRMERAPPSSGNSAMRRRGVGRSSSGTTSIRSAMRLNNTERVGKAIDALDSFSVSTGKYLRLNPYARAAFIMYLMLLHSWTFVLVLWHAHNFENIHRDDMPHGPVSMMQNQLGAGGQAVAAVVEAAKAAAAEKQKSP